MPKTKIKVASTLSFPGKTIQQLKSLPSFVQMMPGLQGLQSIIQGCCCTSAILNHAKTNKYFF